MKDLFISHASEDKPFVRELATALQEQGLDVWFDEMTLKLGDRLGESIDKGLRDSRYGVVVFSPAFFNKSWTRYELEGMVNREMASGKVILPVWHNVTGYDVAQYSPSLANKVAVSSDKGIDYVVSQIMDVVRPGLASSTKESLTRQQSASYHYPSGRDYNTQQGMVKLSRILNDYFNLSEIRGLCFDLGIDYEDLPGATRSAQARELVMYARRRGRLDDLVAEVRRRRPHANV